MTTRKGHLKHRSGQNSCDRAFNFDRLLLAAFIRITIALVDITTTPPPATAAASSKISWSSDNLK